MSVFRQFFDFYNACCYINITILGILTKLQQSAYNFYAIESATFTLILIGIILKIIMLRVIQSANMMDVIMPSLIIRYLEKDLEIIGLLFCRTVSQIKNAVLN
jgi:hypothetical protein